MNELSDAICLLAIINFTIIGLSHIIQSKAWVDFFVALQTQGHVGAMIQGMVTLGVGSLIVSFHNIWAGPQVVLTVVGWLFVIKAAVVFIAPKWGEQSINLVRKERAHLFAVPGLIMIALAIYLSCCLLGAFGA